MNAAREYGLLAEFADVASLRAAVQRLREHGCTHLDAYTPFAVAGLADALGARRNRIAPLMLIGGLLGGVGTFALQVWSAVWAYPLDVGGRPDASWPAFIPAALEMTILGAVLFGFVGLLAGSGLPRLYHPAFNIERFSAASRDGFFVLLRAEDPCYDAARLRELLSTLDATAIDEVPA